MKTIFMVVSCATMIRNFFVIPDSVYHLLKRGGFRIVIITPDPSQYAIKRDFEGNNVVVEHFKINWDPPFLEKLFVFISTYLLHSEGAKFWSLHKFRLTDDWGKNTIDTIKRFTFYPLKFLISRTIGRSKWVRNKLMVKLDGVIFKERPVKDIFEKHRPDIVFLPDVHSPVSTTVLREAKRRGIKTIGMPGSWDHLYKKFVPLKVDKLMVWNEVLKKEALELQDYREDQTFITGSPYYDLFAMKDILLSREDFCKKFGFDKNKKIIFFGSETTYSPDDGDIVDIILNFIKEKRLVYDAQIFLRPYPGIDLEHDKFDKFKDEKLIYTDWIEPQKFFHDYWYPDLDSLVHFANVLYHSDVIVNTYSSISVEASAFLKPIINIGFDGYKTRPYRQSQRRFFKGFTCFTNVLKTGGVITVTSQEELLKALNDFLLNPDSNMANVKKLRDRMCWKVDGQTSERIVEKILEYLKN